MRRANGTGSISKRNGRRRKKYRARITEKFILEDGKAKQVYKFLGDYPTKLEAEQAIHAYLDNPRTFDNITLGDMYERWSARHYPTVRESTRKTYELAWQYLAPLADKRIFLLRTDQLQAILDNNQDKSKSLHKQIKSLAVQIFDYASQNDYVNKNYASFLTPLGQDTKEKAVFTDEEVERIWANQKTPGASITLILLYTGLRISELMTLPRERVFLEERYIQYGIKTKAGKNRIAPIPNRILPLVEKHYHQNGDTLILRDGVPMTADYFRKKLFTPLIKTLHLNPDLTPHSCRHYYATLLNKTVNNKTTIAKLMGHSDYSTTANIYTHHEITDLVNEVENL